MANEIFFLTQVLVVLGFTIGAARIGQSALTALVSLQGVLANLFVVKQMELFGLQVTCSDVFAVGCIVGLNLMQEHFGKEAAKKTVVISFFSMVFFVLVSQIHLWYAPSPKDMAHPAFSQILTWTPRIVIASIAVFFLVQKIDVLFFGYLKRRFSGRHLWLRMGASLFLSQAIDTVLFSFAGLYGIVAAIFDVILVSFAVKCLVIGCSAPIASLSKRFMAERDSA
jgi:queuosine precursor transporter